MSCSRTQHCFNTCTSLLNGIHGRHFHHITGCLFGPDIERFCLTFTIGPDKIFFILVSVVFLQYFLEFANNDLTRFSLRTTLKEFHVIN